MLIIYVSCLSDLGHMRFKSLGMQAPGFRERLRARQRLRASLSRPSRQVREPASSTSPESSRVRTAPRRCSTSAPRSSRSSRPAATSPARHSRRPPGCPATTPSRTPASATSASTSTCPGPGTPSAAGPYVRPSAAARAPYRRARVRHLRGAALPDQGRRAALLSPLDRWRPGRLVGTAEAAGRAGTLGTRPGLLAGLRGAQGDWHRRLPDAGSAAAGQVRGRSPCGRLGGDRRGRARQERRRSARRAMG
jgi:hypothetical protein